jgi:hypothetical protein
MNNKDHVVALILAGMSLATAWAIRGQFGHEQGAAWAGAIGGLSIVIMAGRVDWYPRMFKAVLAAAIGWGIGGMMSYGRVVGYGRGTDFGNVYYGLAMLFVIGALYGFIGGGLFGLALSDSKERRVHWPRLIVQMFAGAGIIYFFLIYQWELLMTPPRSELWAACLGIALALTWYMVRMGFNQALRVAVYAGLGAGFGFAFGNFLQVLGNVAEIQFNWWNVMEYSLGFFGGLGMAYGTYTADWDRVEGEETRKSNIVPMLLSILIIPFIVWQQSFVMDNLVQTYERLVDNPTAMARSVQLVALLLVLAFASYVYPAYLRHNILRFTRTDAVKLFAGLLGLYTIFSFIRTGAFLGFSYLNHYLYILNFVVILLVMPAAKAPFRTRASRPVQWGVLLLVIVVIIGLLAAIAANMHGEMPGAHNRFE